MTKGAAASWLAELEGRGADRPALICQGRSFGYGELVREVAALTGRLEAEGVLAGDLVALLAPPCVEGVVLIHTLLDLGVVMLPLNLRLTEAELISNLELRNGLRAATLRHSFQRDRVC